jgi:hypothetical protein
LKLLHCPRGEVLSDPHEPDRSGAFGEIKEGDGINVLASLNPLPPDDIDIGKEERVWKCCATTLARHIPFAAKNSISVFPAV